MKKMKLAIMAAAGRMSNLAIEEALAKKIDFIIIGFKHISEFDQLKKYKGIRVYQTNIAGFSENLKILKKENVNSLIFVGKINKVSLFKILKFDLAAFRIFLKLKDHSDASLMQGVIDFFSSHGIRTLSQKTFYSKFLADKGFMTRKKCSRTILQHLHWGYSLAKRIAGYNIGQSIISSSKVIISVEGIEGTDNMIRRSKELLLKYNYFIKVARHGHNDQYDLPVFGLTTLDLLHKIRIRTIALEAGMVLIPEKEKLLKKADQYGMIVYGI